MKIIHFTSSGDIHNALDQSLYQYEQWLEEYGTKNAIIHNLTAQTLLEGHKYTHIITVTYTVKSDVEEMLNTQQFWKSTGVVKATWPDILQPQKRKITYYVNGGSGNWIKESENYVDSKFHIHIYNERGYCTICGMNEPSRQEEINKVYNEAKSYMEELQDTFNSGVLVGKKLRDQLQEDMNTGETEDEN